MLGSSSVWARWARWVWLVLAIAPARAGAQERAVELDRYFQAAAANRGFSGNVLVAEDGKVVYSRAFGYASFATKQPNDLGIRFAIASISKTMTATAVLQLEEQGKLRVSDPVAKYLRGFPYPTITIRHLLSHTSGLPPYNAYFDSVRFANPNHIFTNRDFLPGMIARPVPLKYQPGDRGNYDNINFIVLALIVEQCSAQRYQDYIKAHILVPAGMRETRFIPFGEQFDPAHPLARYALPHIFRHVYSDEPTPATAVPYIVSYWKQYRFAGFSDYVTTVADLLKYDQALYHGRLLKPATLKRVFTPVLLNDGRDNPDRYGLGWAVEADTSLGTVVYHSGAATGLSSVLLRNISKRQTVIVFDNDHYDAHRTGTAALRVLDGAPVEWPKRNLAPIFGRVLMTRGAAAARDTLEILRRDTVNYVLNDDDFNALGYDLMGNENPFRFPEEHHYAEAVEAFKVNVDFFPSNWNSFDSYAEALARVGRTSEAIAMYRRSIELNPNNEGGKRALEALERR